MGRLPGRSIVRGELPTSLTASAVAATAAIATTIVPSVSTASTWVTTAATTIASRTAGWNLPLAAPVAPWICLRMRCAAHEMQGAAEAGS